LLSFLFHFLPVSLHIWFVCVPFLFTFFLFVLACPGV
jgi:hypothetical protein